MNLARQTYYIVTSCICFDLISWKSTRLLVPIISSDKLRKEITAALIIIHVHMSRRKHNIYHVGTCLLNMTHTTN